MTSLRTTLLCLWLATNSVLAQPAVPASKDGSSSVAAPTNHYTFEAVQAVRTRCIAGRRIVCGRIVKVLPGGLVVESGYTSLRRPALEKSWLIPGTVEAKREPNLVEKNEPDCVCVGLVYLTDTPKSRTAKPKRFDYVVLEAFPAGEFTYASVGAVQRTVRHFTGSLSVAVRSNLDSGIH